MNRAYSVFNVKSFDEEKRIIRGIATTPQPDRDGDIVEPLGIEFENPLPLLLQHRASEVVGTVEFQKPTAEGVEFVATLPAIAEEGNLKKRVDEAWQSIKHSLIKAVSIGFRPFETTRIEGGGYRFLKSHVFELSLVTIPSNAGALISVVKQLDGVDLAAAGKETESEESAEENAAQEQPKEPAALGDTVPVVKLFDGDGRDRPKPFVIKRIICAGE